MKKDDLEYLMIADRRPSQVYNSRPSILLGNSNVIDHSATNFAVSFVFDLSLGQPTNHAML